MKKILIVLLTGVFILILSGCTKYASEEEMQQLENLKTEVSQLEKEIQAKEQEKASLQREISERDKKIRELQAEKERVQKRLQEQQQQGEEQK
jgi:septal ring factor EnvC (AmiA/AmiB activator)